MPTDQPKPSEETNKSGAAISCLKCGSGQVNIKLFWFHRKKSKVTERVTLVMVLLAFVIAAAITAWGVLTFQDSDALGQGARVVFSVLCIGIWGEMTFRYLTRGNYMNITRYTCRSCGHRWTYPRLKIKE